MSAAVFGGVAGGSFFGVSTLLGSAKTVAESQESGAASLSMVSYTSQTNSQSLDVTDVAAQGLSSVVAVTNISVQEVQSFLTSLAEMAGDIRSCRRLPAVDRV